MTRITTPLDLFLADVFAWLDGAWFVWLSIAAGIAIVILIVTVTKVRARVRYRTPQYRRVGD